VENTGHVSEQCCDKGWVDNTDDRKPTSIEWFSIENSSISLVNKKQNSEFMYSTEVEFIAEGSICTQLNCMKQISL
jgi:hypothetical protein